MVPPPPPPIATPTRVKLPPLSNKSPSTTPSTVKHPPGSSALSNDPEALLDSLDASLSTKRVVSSSSSATKPTSKGRKTTTKTTTGQPPASLSSDQLDPVEFLNRHYTTESSLTNNLGGLRTAVQERMDTLDERISTALQRQSETAESTRRHVRDAKSSVLQLEKRIKLVQSKASQSEKAVLEITRDMKRLDCAKRHLQRTITILKRLHMLIHAVEQLRLAALLKPFPDYKAASHLVDATRLLLKHFDAYQTKVEQMKLLGLKVKALQEQLYNGLVRGFRIVGFGVTKALELEGAAPVVTDDSLTDGIPTPTPPILADGTLLIDALGQETRDEFLERLCEDHLQPYVLLFLPQASKGGGSSKPHSFKAVVPESEVEKPPYSLDQVDRRFAWYRRVIREMVDIFPQVFPQYWNFHYTLTTYFLEKTKDHLIMLLSGPTRDKDSDNATILLKALQKTILFEKEMMAVLQRDFSTVFLVQQQGNNSPSNSRAAARGEEDNNNNNNEEEVLEFDESGRAVAANSAQGIRIKYERQKKQEELLRGDKMAAAALDEGRASAEQVPVDTLLGKASTAFDAYMGPYIALEEQAMDEQLVESVSDTTVDSRGELPVFTSSTGLFVYIKGSITRCTAMTKGKAFFLLFQAFQDSLNKYAQVLSGKLPQASITSVGGLSISSALQVGVKAAGDLSKPSLSSSSASSSSGAAYRIPAGEEVNVCHVISTCEYCVDTVEALEDLIRDTVDVEYKEKVDMVPQQEAFHDVTAKSIGVLVSGLMNRTDSALKAMATTINWSTFDEVGEESTYVRAIHNEVPAFVATCRALIPSSYFRSFCDKFAMGFSTAYYEGILRLKRISEAGTQQLLLDVYNIKAMLLKLPVTEAKTPTTSTSTSSTSQAKKSTTIAPAMYTKMVNKQFKRIETTLKLVGTPQELLIEVFKVQWPGGSALDLQMVMSLKGMKRTEMASMLEKLGLDPQTAMRGATVNVTSGTIVAEHMDNLRAQSSDVAAKVNSDLSQMRQKVDSFRNAFR